MKIRSINEHDLFSAARIHGKHYINEFSFPNFLKFNCAFTISTDEDEPIIIGGVKPIAEIVIVTEKDFNARIRREALLKTLEASAYMAQKSGYDQIHCQITDKVYEKHLKRFGFKTVNGSMLVRDI